MASSSGQRWLVHTALAVLLLFLCPTPRVTCGLTDSSSTLSLSSSPTSYWFQPWTITCVAVDPVRSLIYFVDRLIVVHWRTGR
jgi:hypothetical protein